MTQPHSVRVWLQDESRVGLQLPRPRRLTAQGVKPYQPLYEYYWLYAAVEPATGQTYWWELPALDLICFEAFVHQLGEHFSDDLNLIIIDNAPAHTAQQLQLPDNVVLIYLPPYCPELNPVERLWQDLKSRIIASHHAIRTQLSALQDHVAEIINRYTPEYIQSLTGYPYILHAIREIISDSANG